LTAKYVDICSCIVFALGNYSAYTFHGSLLRPCDLAKRAAAAGYTGAGLADAGGFYGAVEFSQACARVGLRPFLGCRMSVRDLGPVQLTVRNRDGYRALCSAITVWNLGSGRDVSNDEFRRWWESHAGGCGLSVPIAAGPDEDASALRRAGRLYRGWKERWGCIQNLDTSDVWIELGWATAEERDLQRRVYRELAGDWERWVIMTGARLSEPGQGKALCVLQSIGTLTRVGQTHPDKLPPGDYTLPDAAVLRRRFAGVPRVLDSTAVFADGCDFDFSLGKVFLPHWNTGAVPAGSDDSRLRAICMRGLAERYGEGRYPWAGKPSRAALLKRLCRELAVVRETGYAGYFLIFHDVVRACRERGIPLLARGSAAGSLICYSLGVSNVCPFRFGLSFERFLNLERLQHRKLPDIDLDLPWDRRDEIITYLYGKYGAGRVAMIGGFSTFKARSALAETVKCFGRSDNAARGWTRHLPHGRLRSFLERRRDHVESRQLDREEDFAEIAAIAMQLEGLPRHPMMHPCGIVVSDRPLTDFTPIEPSHKGFAMTQMSMEPIEDLGLLKLDLLGQAGLSVIRDAVDNVRDDCLADDPLAGINYGDKRIFELLSKGGARGVFHVESPAMTGLLRLCRCADIDCLVAVVSVIRPGAANENKKNAFARRYLGLDPPTYVHPDLEPILRDTYGLMVYEEHILLVAHHFGGMDLGSADLLRRLLVKKKDAAAIDELGAVFAACARRAGRGENEIATVWRLLRDFTGYMFNKAHGAAYAIEAFEGCWLKYHWPVHFLGAVLQNRRGFYRPLVYIMEALYYGGRIVLPDVCYHRDCYWVEGGRKAPTLHVPLWQISGLSLKFMERRHEAVNERPFADWEDFLCRTRPGRADLMLLARAGALRRFFPYRHRAVWEAQKYRPDEAAGLRPLPAGSIPEFPSEDPQALSAWEMELLGFSITLSPFACRMDGIERRGTIPIDQLGEHVGREVEIAGIVVCTRRHTTVRGEFMKFISLADPTGIAEVSIFPRAYRRYGYAVSRAPAIRARVSVEYDGTRSGLNLNLCSLYISFKNTDAGEVAVAFGEI